jgi:hypothetical protein
MKDGESAFPSLGGYYRHIMSDPGMTLRDWFAGQALTGLLSGNTRPPISTINDIVLKSWNIADAMLAAREEKKSERT